MNDVSECSHVIHLKMDCLDGYIRKYCVKCGFQEIIV